MAKPLQGFGLLALLFPSQYWQAFWSGQVFAKGHEVSLFGPPARNRLKLSSATLQARRNTPSSPARYSSAAKREQKKSCLQELSGSRCLDSKSKHKRAQLWKLDWQLCMLVARA